MHALPVADASFDTVLLMHALTYTKAPQTVFKEAERVLRPGGRLLAATLQKHAHESVVSAYNHVNLGFTTGELEKFCTEAGLDVLDIGISAIEKRTPNFEVLTLLACKPDRV
jgi:ArsR family transcriptional regulator